MSMRDNIATRTTELVQVSYSDHYTGEELEQFVEDFTVLRGKINDIISLATDFGTGSELFLEDFISGVPQHTLRENYPEHAEQKKSPKWHYVVAGKMGKQAVGATGLLTLEQRAGLTLIYEAPPISKAPEANGLRNTIITSYERGFDNDPVAAHGMLLIAGQNNPGTSSATDKGSLARAYSKLRVDIQQSPVFAREERTFHQEKARLVLRLMLDQVQVTKTRFDNRTLNDVVVMFARENPLLPESDVRRLVNEYLTYAFQILYFDDRDADVAGSVE